MKVTSERLPDSRVQLVIESDEEANRKAQDVAYRQVVGRVNIPGFRRGKAPRPIVERVLGRDVILREAAQVLLPELYQKAVEETGIEPIYDPDIDIISLEPLAVKVTVAVRPTVELPDYERIRLPKEEAKVSEEQVERALQNIREQHAEWTPVERPLRVGDSAVIDAVAVQGDEKILEQSGVEYLVDPSRNIPIPGFAEQLVGVVAGEEKTFTLRFPDNFPHQELAAKDATFTVKVHSVKEKRLPELNDDLAKTAGDYETLEQLREAVRKRLLEAAQEAIDYEYAETVVRTVVEQSRVEMPPEMVEEQTEISLHSLEDRLQQQGTSMPEYLAASKLNRLQLLDRLREEARASLRRQLVLNEIAKRENIEVSEAEIDAEIEQAVAMLGRQHASENRGFFNDPEQRRNIAFRLRQQKARQRLAEIASRPAGDEAAAEPAGQ